MGYQKNVTVVKKSRQIPHGWATGKATSEENWDLVDPDTIKDAIVATSVEGDALLFGRTSDGGVMHLMWHFGRERLHQYPKTVDEAEDCLQAVILTYNTLPTSSEDDSTSKGVNAPSRGSKRA